MKFCNYTNFGVLFRSVVMDFPFLCYNQSFKIAKFVYAITLIITDHQSLLFDACMIFLFSLFSYTYFTYSYEHLLDLLGKGGA